MKKLSFLIGTVAAAPLAYRLFSWYASTPDDPQKGVGYVTLSLFVGFVWVVVTMLAEGVFRVCSERKKGGAALLVFSSVGLVAAVSLLWILQRETQHRHRLETTTQGDFLEQEAVAALVRNRSQDLMLIAANPHTPGKTLADLSRCDDLAVVKKVAQNPNAPPSLLKELSGHRAGVVKRLVLQNPSVGEGIVNELLKDPDARVREAARLRNQR